VLLNQRLRHIAGAVYNKADFQTVIPLIGYGLASKIITPTASTPILAANDSE
jgi:hypothetical protein